MRQQPFINQSVNKSKPLYIAFTNPEIASVNYWNAPLNRYKPINRATITKGELMTATQSRLTAHTSELQIGLPPGTDLDARIAKAFYKDCRKPEPYSTDTNCALRVAEAVGELIHKAGPDDLDYLTLEAFGPDNWRASFGEYYWAKSTTPAHAICIACLDVLEVIEKEYSDGL